MHKPFTTVALATLAALCLAPAARANDTLCVGVLIGTFDSVVVPPGATCFLVESAVTGNVEALEDSQLIMENDVVGGNVKGNKARSVNVSFSQVGGNIHIIEAHDAELLSAAVTDSVLPDGNIHIEKGRFPGGDWTVAFNRLEKGKVRIRDNSSEFPGMSFGNDVNGNMRVVRNSGLGLKTVTDNTVSKKLVCEDNEEPFVGGPNTARKTKGQCF